MLKFSHALCAAVVFAGALCAAPPELTIPAEVRPAGGYVRFTPKTTAVAVTYVGLSGVDPFPSEELKDARRFLLPTGTLKEGRYKFAAIGAGANGEQTRTDFEVVIGNAPNPPPIPPGPVPPQPVTNLAWCVVVEESQQRTPATAAVLNDLAMWKRIESKGVKWRVYDKDSADAKAKRYDVAAAPVGLPAVILLDANGAVLGAVKLPKTQAELETLTGGK